MEAFNNTVSFLISQYFPHNIQENNSYVLGRFNFHVLVEWNKIKISFDPSFKDYLELEDQTIIECQELKIYFVYSDNGEDKKVNMIKSLFSNKPSSIISDDHQILRATYLINCLVYIVKYFNKLHEEKQNKIF